MDICFLFFVDFSANLTRKKCNSDQQSSLDAHARFHYVLKDKHIVIEKEYYHPLKSSVNHFSCNTL